MKALIINERLLVWLYFCSDDKIHSKWKRLARIVFSFTVFFVSTSCFPTSLAYVLKFLHINLEESLFALFQVATSTGCIYFSIHAFLFRHRFARLFKTLSDIYDECKWTKNENISSNIPKNKFLQIFWNIFKKNDAENILVVMYSIVEKGMIFILDAHESSFQILASADNFGGWICVTYYKVMGIISSLSILTSFVSVWACCKMYGHFDAQYAMHTDRVM